MKNINDESKIVRLILFLPLAGVILTSFILTNIFISSKYETHESEISELKKRYKTILKETIKERIEHLSLLLNNNYNNDFEKAKESVKNIINIGHKNLENIYKENKHLPKNEIFKIINERMKNIRFFENKSGYYFIYNLEDGVSISLPSSPKLVGISLKNLKDVNGKNLFISYGNIIKEKNEGFDTWYWNKPDSKEKLEKIGYIKKFEPLNIAIGTAVYTDDLKENIKKNIIDFMEKLKYLDNSYIFIMDTAGKALVHKNKSIINVPLEMLDLKIQENVNLILKKVLKENSTFLEYKQPKVLFKDFVPSKKISYVKHIPILNWIIGTGLYTDDLNQQIEQKHQKLEKKLKEDIQTILYVSLLVTLIIIIILMILSKKLKNIFQFYSQSLENSNKELQKLNSLLEEKVKNQVSLIRQKDIVLNQQSKLAAMGEMLGNIAHQWRQPLSAISTLASGTKIQKEMNIINDKEISDNLDNIVKSTQILSNTIDDFRNFYSKDKIVKEFKIEETIEKVLSLISANLKNHEIELIFDIENISIKNYENELIQVILNILNNAKDALADINENKYIFISSKTEGDFLVLEIYDNAGGIKENIINRVFEPYFTTKFKSNGTGIGLYMTKNIIDSSLQGEIKVINKKFEYKNESYMGALFMIKLPLA